MRIFAVLSFIAVAFLLVGSAAATDIDANDTQMISAGAQNDLNTIGANASTYSELADEIGSGGNVTLKHDYYAYDSGDSIEITQNDSVIDGNGAIIDMLGSEVRAFTVNASGVTIKDLTIKNARFNGDGAAIHFNGCGALKNCSFVNNTAAGEDIYGDMVYHEGGAVCFEDAGTVTNCNFTANSAEYGGALRFTNEYAGNVVNCNFDNNSARNGGAVYINSGNVSNSNFVNNSARNGGAVYINSGNVLNSNFVNNFARIGGAIYCSVDGNVVNCNFDNNSATFGGAVDFADMGTVSNCNFTNNRVTGTNCWGGAVDFTVKGNARNCNFVNNTALEKGGAVYFRYSGSLTNCNFTNNRVTGDDGCGGAVYFLDDGNVTNCNFTDNRASGTDGCGGAVYFEYGSLGTLTNCNFTNCLDKSDYALYGNNIRAKNSRFSNSKEDAIYNSYFKVKLGIEFFDEYHMYGENNFFGFMAPNDIEKNISVAIDGKTYDPEGPINTKAPEPWVWRGDYNKDGYYVWFDDLRPGNHKVVISYPGDSKYLSGSFSWTITVHGLTEASNLKATYTDGSYYRITVHDEYGKFAKRVDVVVKLNGKKFKTIKTDSKGIAKFKVTQAPGTYKVRATALGNAVTRTLTVKHIVSLKTVTVKKSAKKLTLKATLAKINGKYLKNKKITFKFNGKKYTAKTDKKGVAKITVKSSVIKKLKAGKKVTYQATYLKDTIKKTVKVQK